ncbi:hypothetical protein RclHR1_03440022 [Rhizophagus clarus]|uniref:Reverse transcriptase domain-containing protein n=1 Tax=Rhizophagus clarus TaxID=94130 RepID=A0A2Z6RQ24_9GLOM|nr:hypothetical protein RclHR1_03440022 [Rhizophagus clarus]
MPKEEAPIPSTSQSVVAPAPVPAPVTQVENSLKNELDALTKQMQQLSINYANLSASVTRTPRFNQSNNRTPRSENINRPRHKREVTCFKYGKLGHYARECIAPGNKCPNQVQFQSNRNNQRPVNFIDYKEEYYETDEYEEYDDEFETEIYAFKRKEPYQREVREVKRRAMPRSESQKEEQTRLVPDVEMQDAEPLKSKKVRRKMLPTPIEQLTEFNVANYLRDLPCRLSVGQAAHEIPKYRNDWLRRVNAIVNWRAEKLSVHYKGRTVNVPLIFTITKAFINAESLGEEDEEENDEEYENEELVEAPLYYSDTWDSDSDDLDYNPWMEMHSPDYSDEEVKSDDKNEGNPAVFLAEVQTKIGKTHVIRHRILTGDVAPVAQPPYRMNPVKRKFSKNKIVKMEVQDIIRKSSSPWASPVVIIEKKGGDKRLCIDYQKLNAITKADAYPLPRIDDLLKNLRSATWFTTLDLASGYWQVQMSEEDIEKTAFITPFSLYEFLVMPFGLVYALGTFQRLMNYILQDFLGIFVAVYLDDVIIYTRGPLETHLDHLRQVFETLQSANFQIKLKKCYFCYPKYPLPWTCSRKGWNPSRSRKN